MSPPPVPGVFVSYADDSGDHTDAVLRFAHRLRAEHGVDVRLDLWERDRRRDWFDWAVEQIDHGDFVLAIASHEYRRLAGPDDAARGNARFQLAMLREHLAADRPRWLPRVLPVVLPGHSADELPAFLQPYSATHYVLPGQLDELLRVLHGQPRHVMPGLAPRADPARWQQDALFRTTPVRTEMSLVLVEAAERLAGAVTTVWRGEVERLGLNAPRPLATRYAVDGVPFDRIASLLRDHAPNRRLLLLGGPGSGKSVAAIRLVSEALVGWTPGEPVPILVPVTDWNPDELHAFDWLARRLARDHGLGRSVRWVDGRTTTLAAALLEVGLILPVLDGLETLADDLRPRAVAALDRLGSSVPLVVTCGLAEYQELEAAGVGLARVTRAELLSPDRDDVEHYLREKVPHGNVRLAPLFARLREEPVPTPLVVWLIGTTYQDLVRDPAELLDRNRFPDLASIEAHLLSHLIPAVYPDDPSPRGRPSFPRAHHAVVHRWLAHLARNLDGEQDMAWWRLHRSLPAVAPTCRGLGGAVFGFGHFSTMGLVPGLVAAGVAGLAINSGPFQRYFNASDHLETPHALKATAERVRADLRDLAGMMVNWLLTLAGVLALLLAVLGISSGLSGSARSIVVVTALIGGGGFLVWFFGRRAWRRMREDRTGGVVGLADLERPTNPVSTLRADRSVVLVGTGSMVVLAALSALLGLEYVVRITLGYAAAWALVSAYTYFTVARLLLAARGRLPWRLMAFLDNVRDRGVLRQYGAVHQFRHQQVQRHLAQHNPAGGPAR